MLPPFLVELLREHLATTDNPFVFTTRTGRPIRRSTFDRRVFRPAVDGDARRGLPAVRTGLTFHGLRHSHKTWLIADHIPEIAQAKRLGHHLANHLVEVYSHVAPEIEQRLLDTLERRYHHARKTGRPKDTRPRNRRSRKHAHHTAPAQRTTTPQRQKSAAPQLTGQQPANRSSIQDTNVLQDYSNHRQSNDHDFTWPNDHRSHENALRPGKTPDSKGFHQPWA
jgi:hypothetical protein